MQNVAARIVSCCDKRSHITPVLHSLHWLPIEQRIKYKILLMTFKCVHDLAPQYLCELINQQTPNRSRRSQYQNSLILPRTRLKSCGDRTFSFATPTKWNKLPPHLKISLNIDSFKKNLKTFLFDQYFSTCLWLFIFCNMWASSSFYNMYVGQLYIIYIFIFHFTDFSFIMFLSL